MAPAQAHASTLQPLSHYLKGLCAGCQSFIVRGERAIRLEGNSFHVACTPPRQHLDPESDTRLARRPASAD